MLNMSIVNMIVDRKTSEYVLVVEVKSLDVSMTVDLYVSEECIEKLRLAEDVIENETSQTSMHDATLPFLGFLRTPVSYPRKPPKHKSCDGGGLQ